jgi:hypothetical protein
VGPGAARSLDHGLPARTPTGGREALGSYRIEPGIENIAYLVMKFPDDFIAHFHFSLAGAREDSSHTIAGARK